MSDPVASLFRVIDLNHILGVGTSGLSQEHCDSTTVRALSVEESVVLLYQQVPLSSPVLIQLMEVTGRPWGPRLESTWSLSLLLEGLEQVLNAQALSVSSVSGSSCNVIAQMLRQVIMSALCWQVFSHYM